VSGQERGGRTVRRQDSEEAGKLKKQDCEEAGQCEGRTVSRQEREEAR